MRYLFQLLKNSIYRFSLAIVLSLISGVAGSYALKIISNSIQTSGNWQTPLMSLGICILIFTLCSGIAAILLHTIIQEVIMDLSLGFSKKLTSVNYQSIENRKDKIFNVLTHDIYIVASTIERIPDFLISISISIGCLIYMLFLSWEITLAILFLVLVVFIFQIITNKTLGKIAIDVREAFEAFVIKTKKMTYGMRELTQSSVHRAFFVEQDYKATLLKKKQLIIREKITNDSLSKIAYSILLFGVGVLIILSGTIDQHQGENFTEFFLLILFILGPLNSVGNFLKSLKPLNASLRQIEGLGLSFDAHLNRIDQKQVKNRFESVIFENISFSFSISEKNAFKLHPVSFQIMPGKVLFISGGNGSGKTTFGKIAAGIYLPSSGKIVLDGIDVEKTNYQEYRDLFSVIWNDNELFENINYTAWEAANPDSLLEKFNLKGVTTLENGIYSNLNLSAGQLKRVAFITMLLENRPILLLDEWAANQDKEFKDFFYRELIPELKQAGKALLIISHDSSYFDIADEIIELQDGKHV